MVTICAGLVALVVVVLSLLTWPGPGNNVPGYFSRIENAEQGPETIQVFRGSEAPSMYHTRQQGSLRCNIKGNINQRGERIYHVPDGEYYERTRIDTSRGERWFCTEGGARAAGWRRSRR